MNRAGVGEGSAGRVSRRSVVAAVVGVLAVGAVVVGAAVSGAPTPAVPPAPPTSDTQTVYEGYLYNPGDPEIARRIAAGEDPRTIPGLIAVPGSPTRPSPSSPASGMSSPQQTVR